MEKTNKSLMMDHENHIGILIQENWTFLVKEVGTKLIAHLDNQKGMTRCGMQVK